MPPSKGRSSKSTTPGPDEAACRRQVFRWLVRYNTRRRHSWCRYQSPNTYETSYIATAPDSRVINHRVQEPGVRPDHAWSCSARYAGTYGSRPCR
jgi:hypothetical protein